MRTLLISVQRDLDIIGLKLLHHVLLENGQDSHLLYLPFLSRCAARETAALEEFLKGLAPGLVGVSLMGGDYTLAVRATQLVRSVLPDSIVIWGGIHATTAPRMCLDYADYACLGEGEQTLLEITRALDAHEPLDSIRNLAFVRGDTFVANPLYPLIEDLDSLPVPRQLPPNSYVHTKRGVAPLEVRHLTSLKRYNGRIHKIITSRGCPYGCTYCCNHLLRRMYGRWPVRRRSPAHVLTELRLACAEGPALEYVDFIDDCFLSCGIEYLREFCRGYKETINLPFIAKGTPHYFTREKLALAVESGLVWANMGLQSGSDRICSEVYGRAITSAEFLRAARLLAEFPVSCYYDIIVDNPFETIDDTLATAEVLMAVPRPCYGLIFSMTFFFGTELRERALRECPEAVEDVLTKDYLVRRNRPANDLIEVATLLHRPLLKMLIRAYRRNPEGHAIVLAIRLCALYGRLILAPITYFRLIRRAQGGRLLSTLRILPTYFGRAIVYYLNHFDFFKRSAKS